MTYSKIKIIGRFSLLTIIPLSWEGLRFEFVSKPGVCLVGSPKDNFEIRIWDFNLIKSGYALWAEIKIGFLIFNKD